MTDCQAIFDLEQHIKKTFLDLKAKTGESYETLEEKIKIGASKLKTIAKHGGAKAADLYIIAEYFDMDILDFLGKKHNSHETEPQAPATGFSEKTLEYFENIEKIANFVNQAVEAKDYDRAIVEMEQGLERAKWIHEKNKAEARKKNG